MQRKRIIILAIGCLLAICLLLGRLMQLQLFATEHFSRHRINLIEASVKQRTQEMVLDNGRGNFLDRNGISLTHEKRPVLILFPFLKQMEWDVKAVADEINVSPVLLEKAVENAKEPFAYGDPEPLALSQEQIENINNLKIPGVFAVEKMDIMEKNTAEHLIGITGESEEILRKRYPDKELSPQTLVGLSGLQKSFDEFLLPEGKSKLVYHVDATGGPLFGINVKYAGPVSPFYPVNIKTTIDDEFQRMAERLTDQHQIKKGGIVLLDIHTNTVLAMVSRPELNRHDPYNAETGGIENEMIKQQIPGSVFKTVVAAAAIDYGLVDGSRLFDCSRKINGEADPAHPYGMLTFSDSFARSCNNTFATLANELREKDPTILGNYAKSLSLVGTVAWEGEIYHLSNFRQLHEEEAGRVFLKKQDKKDKNFVAMTAIGQHEVRVTPLAAANMMATIARGGQKEEVRVASKVEFKNGTSMVAFKPHKMEDSLSKATVIKLQSLLREVIVNENGTGRVLRELPFQVAGKSGTAETGIFKEDKQLHNKWFAGYFPFENPKYALVTVQLDVYGDEGGVNPLFADIVKEIYNLEQKKGKVQ
ncbi:penicillin-binding protein 2 [Bacillaceae bacterium Marseille-Q3522]|nr:penicillin-binding protein 2 [Bacillaceae bacterium Marseille-Q3522]